MTTTTVSAIFNGPHVLQKFLRPQAELDWDICLLAT